MYVPSTESALQIINNANLKLPRFQRKQAWKDDDRFKLCISLFKGYPLGTIVVKKDNKISWLLDGRQRRDTLMEMSNPVNVYNWAKNFIGFKTNDDISQITDAFYKKLTEFLYTDDELVPVEEGSDVNSDSGEIDEVDDGAGLTQTSLESFTTSAGSLDKNDKRDLDDLLEIICSVHKTTKASSNFTKPFDFKDESYRPKYYSNVGGTYVVDSTKLTKWILGQDIKEVDKMTTEEVIALFDGCPDKLKKNIEFKVTEIKRSIKCVFNLREHLNAAVVSVITLDENCSFSDSRKIFEIINKQGVALTNAEILSAKPSWNTKLTDPREVLKTQSKELYTALGVEQSDVVAWDVAATFTSRLSENSDYIFGDVRTTSFVVDGRKNTANDIDKKINYGFKLLAGRYSESITKLGVESIPNHIKDWNSDEFENEIKDITDTIYRNDMFIQHLDEYNRSLAILIGDTVAMNYLLTLIKKFKADNLKASGLKGKPRKQFLVNSRILLDRFIYEYAKGEWAGSSDSRLKNNLEHTEQLFKPIADEDWDQLIEEAYTKNTIGGQQTKKNRLVAMLYYFSLLRDKRIHLSKDEVPEVDHIIPDSEFVDGSNNKEFKDSLINYALLSPILNNKKSNSYASLDNATKKDIADLEDISVETLDGLANPGTFKTLYDERIVIKDKIKQLRKEFVRGEGEWDLKA